MKVVSTCEKVAWQIIRHIAEQLEIFLIKSAGWCIWFILNQKNKYYASGGLRPTCFFKRLIKQCSRRISGFWHATVWRNFRFKNLKKMRQTDWIVILTHISVSNSSTGYMIVFRKKFKFVLGEKFCVCRSMIVRWCILHSHPRFAPKSGTWTVSNK